VNTVACGGTYYRVCDPGWTDPLDTSFAKKSGGRWNQPGVFGAIYLNKTRDVAAANARRQFEGEIATLYDLQPDQQPDLVTVMVDEALAVDVVSAEGIAALRLPASYPVAVVHERCHEIAELAYTDENIAGVACRSNAEATETSIVGEELAVFDRSSGIVHRGDRVPFGHWYPTEVGGPPSTT
jgi:RES domain-containing protein